MNESSLVDRGIEFRDAEGEVEGRSTWAITARHRDERFMKEPATVPSAAVRGLREQVSVRTNSLLARREHRLDGLVRSPVRSRASSGVSLWVPENAFGCSVSVVAVDVGCVVRERTRRS